MKPTHLAVGEQVVPCGVQAVPRGHQDAGPAGLQDHSGHSMLGSATQHTCKHAHTPP